MYVRKFKDTISVHTNNYGSFLSSYLFFMAFVLFLFLLTICTFGTYYGWLDDVYALNLIKGTFSARGYSPTDQFLLISDILIVLYKYLPQIPWYGINMLLFAYFGVVNIFYFLDQILKPLKYNKALLILLYTLIYFLLLAENIVLLNFTRISILITGSSLLCLFHLLIVRSERDKQIIKIIWLSFLSILGYLIRYDGALFPIIFVLLYAFILSIPEKRRSYKFLVIFSGVIFLVLSHLLMYQLFKTKDLERHYQKRPYVFNILDANNIRNYKELASNPKDSIRMYATFSWYHYDNEQIDIPFLKKLGGKDYFLYTLYTWKKNIREEYVKIKDRKEGYQLGLKLTEKLYFIIALNVVLMLLALVLCSVNGASRIILLRMFLVNLSFYLLFFLSTVFIKYEDRVFSPTAVLLFIVNLGMLSQLFSGSKNRMGSDFIIFIILLMLPLTIVRANILKSISRERQQELQLKAKFIEELNTAYSGKIFLYDLWTLGLIHGTPINEIQLTKNNIHTIYGDSYYQDISAHRDYVNKNICQFEQFVDFYDCIEQKNNVLFVLVDFRANLIENYFRILYSRDLSFQSSAVKTTLKDIHYSFVWEPLRFDLYKLK